MIRKCLKVIGTVAAILVGVVAVYVIYLFTTYHRIADNLPLTVEQPAKKGTDVDALAIGTEYTALTYNIGFGAYTPDFSFFMDGGESSWAKSKESVLDTVQGAGDLVASLRPDFALIEEIDLDSTRSYHTDEYALLKECLPEDYTVFAQNYDSAFLFYPLNQPHGSSKSGLGLFFRISGYGSTAPELSDFYVMEEISGSGPLLQHLQSAGGEWNGTGHFHASYVGLRKQR